MSVISSQLERGELPSMFPGLASAPNKFRSFNASASPIRRFARPSNPAIGFCSVTCRPAAIFSTVNSLNPAPSTWCGWTLLLLNRPSLNISKLAMASPSLLLYVRPFCLLLYDQAVPAPASRSTETRKRSRSLRHCSDGSTLLGQLESSSAIRSRPPELKCCQRPWGGILA